MSDPTRLLEGADPLSRRLLQSADADRPGSNAARTTLVALGLTAPVAAAAAAPVAAAVQKGTLATVLGSVTAKVAIAVTAAAVASGTVVALAPKPPQRAAAHAPQATPSHAAAPKPAPLSSLVAESTLLRGAADALAAHDAHRALSALEEHATRFPHGQLAEEAAALKVEALDASGDAAAARTALQQFQARFPDSPFAPVIKAAPTGDVSPQADKETLK